MPRRFKPDTRTRNYNDFLRKHKLVTRQSTGQAIQLEFYEIWNEIKSCETQEEFEDNFDSKSKEWDRIIEGRKRRNPGLFKPQRQQSLFQIFAKKNAKSSQRNEIVCKKRTFDEMNNNNDNGMNNNNNTSSNEMNRMNSINNNDNGNNSSISMNSTNNANNNINNSNNGNLMQSNRMHMEDKNKSNLRRAYATPAQDRIQKEIETLQGELAVADAKLQLPDVSYDWCKAPRSKYFDFMKTRFIPPPIVIEMSDNGPKLMNPSNLDKNIPFNCWPPLDFRLAHKLNDKSIKMDSFNPELSKDDLKKLICPICLQQFQNQTFMKSHRSKMHQFCFHFY